MRQKKPLLQPESGRTQSESIPEGLSLVIQSPLAMGSQKKISLRVLCASAVNLVLIGTNDNPKPQWNQPSPLGIPLNLDSNDCLSTLLDVARGSILGKGGRSVDASKKYWEPVRDPPFNSKEADRRLIDFVYHIYWDNYL